MIRTDFIPNVDRRDYFAGRLTQLPALSQSIANVLVSQSPKHAWAQHPNFGNRRRVATKEMDIGNVLDELVLGGIDNKFAVLDFDEFRSNAAKAARDAVIEAGKIPLKRKHYDEYLGAATAAKASLADAGVKLEAMPQVCLLWPETASNGNQVQCSALLDLLDMDTSSARIWDLKTSNDCRPSALPRKVAAQGLQVQAAVYTRAVETVFYGLSGRVSFQNAWLESVYPFVSYTSEMDGEAMAIGRMLWQKAVDLWECCTRTGQWPAYEHQRVSLPAYALAEMFPEEGNGDDDAAA